MTDPALVFDLSLRTVTAVSLGAAIGLERQWKLRTAGIRTNALVAGGAALFVILGAVDWGAGAVVDPTRVAAQVVSGIGFLGAGVILRDGFNIRGLTTAATLWCAAAIGSLSGAGMMLMAAIGTGVIVATNVFLRPLSRIINRRLGNEGTPSARPADIRTDYELEVITTEKSEQRIRALVLQSVDRPDYMLRSLDIRSGKNSQTKLIAGVSARTPDPSGLQLAVQRLVLDPKVTSSRWWATENED